MQVYFLILYFFTYGFLGWCTEVAYATAKQKRFVNRGFLNGPVCPIYGVGVSVVIYFLTPVSGNFFFLYLSSTVLVTVLEGLTGYFMDKIFHHKWWDYSNQPLNIGGYVCLIFSLVWGVARLFGTPTFIGTWWYMSLAVIMISIGERMKEEFFHDLYKFGNVGIK